jgi:hypothetical protein
MDKQTLKIRESIMVIGKKKTIVAIITESNLQNNKKKECIVFINAGFTKHTGPNRIYVRLSRYLADQGFVTCRFDVSGFGDSLSLKNESFRKNMTSDTIVVLNELVLQRKVSSFILIGLCSGADFAFESACFDPRVAGLVLINGSYINGSAFTKIYHKAEKKTRLRYYLRHMFSFSSWIKLITMKSNLIRLILSRLKSIIIRDKSSSLKNNERNENILDVSKWQKLADRNVEIILVFAEGSVFWDIFKSYVKKSLQTIFNGNIRIILQRNVDHTFTLLSSQIRLQTTILNWLYEKTGTFNTQ